MSIEQDHQTLGLGGFETISSASRLIKLPETFKTLLGEEIPCGRLAYQTWGKLNNDRSNAVLILSGMSSGSHVTSTTKDRSNGWWEHAVGVNRPIDTKKYFVISASMLGSCWGSTGAASLDPANNRAYGVNFPILSIYDQASVLNFLMDELGISSLHTVIGLSMGGSLAKAFLRYFSGKIQLLTLVSSSLKASPHAKLWRELQIQLIQNDPDWNNGNYTNTRWPRSGMVLARKLGLSTYTGARNLEKMKKPLASFVQKNANKFTSCFDPICFIRMAAMQNSFSFNGPLKCFPHKVLVIGSSSDILFPSYQQREVYEYFHELGIPVVGESMFSGNGHDMFLREQLRIGKKIRQYMNNTQSGTSKCRTMEVSF